MTASPAVRHSPLESLGDALASAAPSTAGAVALRELPFLAQVDLRCDPSDSSVMRRVEAALGGALGTALPIEPNTVATLGDLAVLWLGPDEWLIVGSPDAEGALEARLREALGDAVGSVVDVSANRTTIEVRGPAARELLAAACSVDLHLRAFGPGRCAQTALARAAVILHQTSDEPCYRILVRPSFATYLARWLLDALDGLEGLDDLETAVRSEGRT
ncbi:MAG: sarcosine oxidase subunit gamma [Chloroflexi bacterium]|nr:MAG: sarcosine oxidase subunit gamma [Chloroflexota bacterium]